MNAIVTIFLHLSPWYYVYRFDRHLERRRRNAHLRANTHLAAPYRRAGAQRCNQGVLG